MLMLQSNIFNVVKKHVDVVNQHVDVVNQHVDVVNQHVDVVKQHFSNVAELQQSIDFWSKGGSINH